MLVKLLITASLLSFAVLGCKELATEQESNTTSDGIDLRKPMKFDSNNNSNLANNSNLSDVPTGEEKSCTENSALFNGFCLELEVLYIWQHSSNLSSFLSFKNQVECATNAVGCPDMTSYSLTSESFKVIENPNEAVLSSLYPVFSLLSQDGYQYLTRQAGEKDFLIEKSGYTDQGVLFYLTPGNSLGSKKLARFAKVEGLGPWKYQLTYDAVENYSFDTSIGNVIGN